MTMRPPSAGSDPQMLIRCPSCSTRFDLPSSRLDADGTMIKCSVCNHSWIEGRAIEILAEPSRNAIELAEPRYEPDGEIRRLVDASLAAQEAFVARRRKRNKTIAAWSVFALIAISPLAVAAATPETVVRFAPASISIYDRLGWNVNIYGLAIRKVETQHLNSDGTRVIAVKGEIVNTSSGVRKIPWLRFGLKNAGSEEVYSWQLDTNARPLQPGESTSFVTRIASPPEAAEDLEIRFARIDEIGSTPSP